MSRNPRINPVAGDVLAIGISQWKVLGVTETNINVGRMGSVSPMKPHEFRSFFKLASTVRYGDET